MSLDYYSHSSFKESWNGLGLVYSCDMITVTGQFLFGRDAHMLALMRHFCEHQQMAPDFPWQYRLMDVRFYEKMKAMCYRNNFVLEFCDARGEEHKVSFYFAVGFNSGEGYKPYWKLEFNPNKILVNCDCWMREFLCELKNCTKVGGPGYSSVEVKSFDLAIDFPCERDCVLYEKRNRMHKMFMYTALDRTDYYGESHKHGATKIYNKGLEAKLSRPLTRLEVTLELTDYDSVRKYFEDLRVLRHGQVGLDELGDKLSQNDKAVLELLNLHPEYLSRFNWAARKKYKPYLEDFMQPFVLSLKGFNKIANWTAWFYSMNIGGIFGDDD